MKSLINISDFFIPRFCICCNSKLSSSELLVCNNCRANFKRVEDETLQNEYKRKFIDNHLISDFYSHLIFEKESEIQTLIHSLKYNGKFLVGQMLGTLIAKEARNKINSWHCDVIIPIPLHPLKKATRGYNQAYYIAKGISKTLGIPILANGIKRIKMTKTQTKLNAIQRKENMHGAFKIRRKKNIQNKNILLIDDVITTGATVKECAKSLIKNNASKVFALSVAIANPNLQPTFSQEQ